MKIFKLIFMIKILIYNISFIIFETTIKRIEKIMQKQPINFDS